MKDPLQQLEDWAAPLLERLEPPARRALTHAIARDLRRSQQRRIADQRNPDGRPFAPRRPRKDPRGAAGRIRRRAMFVKLRQARHLRAGGDASQAWVGFVGRVARIAHVHQAGLRDRVDRDGPEIRYERRELLGLTQDDIDRIEAQLIEHLTGAG